MEDPKDDPVKDPNAAGAGSGSGDEGAGAGSGEGTSDQEISIKVGGKEVKVRTSEILDERGVPFKQMNSELQRKLDEANATLQQISEQGGGTSEEGKKEDVKAGQFVDPVDGQRYNEEDLNRMMMTGEGTKALRIVMNPKQVGRVVEGAIQAREVKAATRSRYPDLNNPKSEFFVRTSMYMQSRGLYDHPQGLALASAAVAEDMRSENRPFATGTRGNPEEQRRSQQSGHVIPGRDGSGKPIITEHELDEGAKNMAAKLGVDPKKYAARLATYLDKKSNRKSEEGD